MPVAHVIAMVLAVFPHGPVYVFRTVTAAPRYFRPASARPDRAEDNRRRKSTMPSCPLPEP
jgi:hypothetical protein